jgi:transposase
MELREQRGLVIAAMCKLTKQDGGHWIVPSQTTGGKKYVVDLDHKTCTCPDHQETGFKCKHLYAVEFTIKRELGADGTITETKTITFTEKRTYKQDWPAYNLAQTTEKHRFQVLLRDLCRGVPPFGKKPGVGRTPVLASDAVFAACFKVYSTVSTRRFACDLKDAYEKGYVTKPIHYNSICAYLENPELTPRLNMLITQSSLPLKAVETVFVPDSTGFSTSRFVRWFDEKYGVERSGHDWVKAHAICGVKTNIVTAVIIEGRDAGDAPLFKPLVEATAQNFTIREVPADKGYLSVENIETVFRTGGTPYIAFKVNSTGGAGGLFEKMYHYYEFNREEYLRHYHQRSNAESTFSMVKAKFRDHVRSRTDVAMKNEVLCKFICHNICCLIQSQCELGIEPVFWTETEVGNFPTQVGPS